MTKDSAVYRIGAAHQGAVYTMSSGACELLDDARYELGERVPDDMIACGRVVD